VTAEFIALADLLRARVSRVPAEPPARAEPVVETAAHHDAPNDGAGAADAAEIAASLREARLFRARLADALDDAAGRLARDLAADVLARELRLAPCDLARIVQRVMAGAPAVRVRVAPGDAGRVTGIAVLADPALCAGDAIVEVAGGMLDARLGVRLAAVLEAFP
jgi:flagellar biosynthesis/type III secretory pathway protein FliH